MILSVIMLISILGVLYVYIGYPIIIFILAKSQPRPIKRNSSYPSITLIISAYNEAPFVQRKIENSLSLRYPQEKLQIIFSSDGSTDQSDVIASVAGGDKVKVLHHQERKGKPSAINAGLSVASGDIIILSDVRFLYDIHALERIINNFSDDNVGLVSGKISYIKKTKSLISDFNNKYFSYEGWLNQHETVSGSTVSAYGAILAFRRNLVSKVPPNIINDDAFIALKILNAGKRVVYEPEAVAYGIAPRDEQGDAERRIRISAGRFQILATKGLMPRQNFKIWWQYVSHKVGRLFLPFLMITALLPGFVAVLCKIKMPILGEILFYIQILFYFIVMLGFFFDKYKFGPKIIYLPWYLLRNNLSILIGFYRFLSSSQTVLWKRSLREI